MMVRFARERASGDPCEVRERPVGMHPTTGLPEALGPWGGGFLEVTLLGGPPCICVFEKVLHFSPWFLWPGTFDLVKYLELVNV